MHACKRDDVKKSRHLETEFSIDEVSEFPDSEE